MYQALISGQTRIVVVMDITFYAMFSTEANPGVSDWGGDSPSPDWD